MHIPVFCSQAVRALCLEKGGIFLDATYGRGGHSAVILEQCLQSKPLVMKLIAMDRDPDAQLDALRYQKNPCFKFILGNFQDAAHLCRPDLQGPFKQFSGILFDLGVSSPQLDQAERGFSFTRSGPLDMRMNPTVGLSAAEWLKRISADELTYVLKAYGEERFARKISRAIMSQLKKKSIETTEELSNLVIGQIGFTEEKHPATRTFQAIRMAVNNEVSAFTLALTHLLPLLRTGGRLVIITFHGIEVRILRSFLRRAREGEEYLALYEKISPTPQEIEANRRMRSATLWVLEKRRR